MENKLVIPRKPCTRATICEANDGCDYYTSVIIIIVVFCNFSPNPNTTFYYELVWGINKLLRFRTKCGWRTRTFTTRTTAFSTASAAVIKTANLYIATAARFSTFFFFFATKKRFSKDSQAPAVYVHIVHFYFIFHNFGSLIGWYM